MTESDSVKLLVLHAVRILGYAGADAVARRFGLDAHEAAEALGDAEARGLVSFAAFADLGGWSLTELGRAENERLLADQLRAVDGEAELQAIYRDFIPLNTRLLSACTDWQLRPDDDGRLTPNDHHDPEWDARVMRELVAIEHELAPLSEALESILGRFRHYDTRFTEALARAHAGDHRWVDATNIGSCHRVWFELHEDLIATLGIDRHAES